MPFSKAISLVAVLFFLLACSSCVEDKDYGEANNLRPSVNRNVETNTNQNIADDSEEKLDSLVNLPFEPIENVFREETVSSVSNSGTGAESAEKRLVVVLRFAPDDTARLIEKVSKNGTPFKTNVEAEPWFPAELIAKSGTSGNEQLKGTGYDAQGIAIAPWLSGSLIKIDDTDYFVLLLQRKKQS